MKVRSTILLATALFRFSVPAKTPEQRKAEFSDLLPPGKKARLAGIQGCCRHGGFAPDPAQRDHYSIFRVNIDEPTKQVTLWNRTDVTRPRFTLSADGTRLGLSPGGLNIGNAVVPNGPLRTVDSIGCRIKIAPDRYPRATGSASGHTRAVL